jgi:hypothetical protein
LEKAKDNKRKGDLQELYSKGNNRKTAEHANSKHLHKIACTVGVVREWVRKLRGVR